MFLQQVWYAAWWADELTADKLYARIMFDRKPVLLPTDSASTRARRVYSRLLKAEHAATTAVQG